MNARNQIEVTPRFAAQRNLTARTAVASLAFAAWEQPQLFSQELRVAFKSLRADKATALNR